MAESAEARLRTVLHPLVERERARLAKMIGGDSHLDSLQIETDDT